ncbi:hypothetical protein OAJ93_01820 [Gammaproteobacteria bacterium]|nr:hypothetical protein [Gammaproteobacteria bacterium]
MRAKAILTVIGSVMFLQGLAFYFFSIPITQNMFPDAGNEAIKVGSVHRELLAAGSMFIGIILFLSRTNVTSSAKRILFGASIGFSVLLAILAHISYTNDTVSIPIAPFIIFAIFAIIAFFYGDPGIGDRRGY